MDISQDAHQIEYFSFLLRLWRVTVEGAPAWRASLQRPGAAEAIPFADLEVLVAFLKSEMGEGGAAQPLERGPVLPHQESRL